MIPKGTRGPGFKGSSDPPQNRRIKMLKNYKDMKVWQKSYELCLEIYRITSKFPKEERQPWISLGCFTYFMVLFANWKRRYYWQGFRFN